MGKGKRKERMFETEVEKVKIRSNQNLIPKSEVIEYDDQEETTEEEGVLFDDEDTDSPVSFNSEKNKVYTLCEPPRIAENPSQNESIVNAKNVLRSFLLRADPSDIPLLITQSNTIFTFLKNMNSGDQFFYYNVRSFIRSCIELYRSEQKLKESQGSQNLVSHYDQIGTRIAESETAVSGIEDNIVKAKSYTGFIEARVQDAKENLEKLEIEFTGRKAQLAILEVKKVHKMEVIEQLGVEFKATASDAEKIRTRILDDIARHDKAKVGMDNARNQLQIM